MDLVGQQVGNYDLVEHLGSGGYAEVYRGIYRRFQVEVALKMLKVQAFSATQEQDFRQEAQIITALRHPHIIRVLNYDVWQEPEGLQRRIPYIVMTYAPLGSLRQAYPEGQRVDTPLRIALYIKQMAEALQEAHNQSVVHCDIKPENMLRISEDDLVLTDFGIAKDHHRTVEVPQLPNTRPEAPRVFGTPGYLPPERCVGGPVSRSGDQYALAIVAYEWLTGRRPFEGNSSIEILTKQATLPPPSMRARFPEISQEVEDVVMKALAREAADRYPTILQFAEAFEQAISVQQAASSAAPQHRVGAGGAPVPPKAEAGKGAPVPPKAEAGKGAPAPLKAEAGKGAPVPPKAEAGKGAPVPPKAEAGKGAPVPPKAEAGKGAPVPPKAGAGAGAAPQRPIVLPGDSGYSTKTMGNTQPSRPSSPPQSGGTSGFEDFKALWTFHPLRGFKRRWARIEWLRTDPPARFSRRPRTMFPLVSQCCIVLVTLLLAFLTLPYGLLLGFFLEFFFYRFLRWALYLVRPGVANFFLSLVSLYYVIGFVLLCVRLLPLFSRSPGLQAFFVALPALVFLLSVVQNRHYVRLMHRQ